MVAVKSAVLEVVALASVKLATGPLKDWPLTGAGLMPDAFRLASFALAMSVTVVEFAALSVSMIVTVMV